LTPPSAQIGSASIQEKNFYVFLAVRYSTARDIISQEKAKCKGFAKKT
jgi:hypothetical protein